MAKSAAPVPKPRMNLTRHHRVLASNSKHRMNVTPAKRGRASANKLEAKNKKHAQLPISERQKMTWAQRLKSLLNIDVTICNRCGGAVKMITCIEDLGDPENSGSPRRQIYSANLS
jgi:hypothetical protein